MNGKDRVWNLKSAKKAFWAAWKTVALISLICMSRYYELPEWLVLISPVYWIIAPCSFNSPISLQMQHCAVTKNEKVLSGLKFVTSTRSQRDLPYQGTFSSFGTIQRSHFCCTAIAGHKDTPQLPIYLRNYIVHIYTMQKNRCTTWNSTWPSRKTIQ